VLFSELFGYGFLDESLMHRLVARGNSSNKLSQSLSYVRVRRLHLPVAITATSKSNSAVKVALDFISFPPGLFGDFITLT